MLNHFSKLFVQCKAYGNNHATNSGFKSAAAMYNTPSEHHHDNQERQ
jgi:hypothetical protein